MNISIFGLGYVGCVCAGCLAQDGHAIVGVDEIQKKIDLINRGKATVIEKGVGDLIRDQRKRGKISATTDYMKAIQSTDLTFVCVGTPSTEEGSLNLNSIIMVAEQIGEALKKKNSYHTIVVRSTVPPGTNHKVCKIIEDISGKKKNVDFGVVSNPEFIREGSAVSDYYNPAVIVIGSDSEKSLNLVKRLYRGFDAPVEVTDVAVAEVIKYVNNSFHALKVSFANEVGNICKRLGVDSHKVMEIFIRDGKLNISPSYLKPGIAYGGSCLPKDLKALKRLAYDLDLSCPVIEAINESNENQKQLIYRMVKSKNETKIGIIGLSFKPGTDDLRYSPIVDLAKALVKDACDVAIYDAYVYESKLIGTNKAYIERVMPQLSELIMSDIDAVISKSRLLVVAHKYRTLPTLLAKYPDKKIIDLVRIADNLSFGNYEGICW